MTHLDSIDDKIAKIAEGWPSHDQHYLRILLESIDVSSNHVPKFGRHGGISSPKKFQGLYATDPFYSWFGLNDSMIYAAHKAAGGMTSIYRQIGSGCEKVFRQILQDHLGPSYSYVHWSYTVSYAGASPSKLHLDGRIDFDAVKNQRAKDALYNWLTQVAKKMDIDNGIRDALKGVVFEVRQGYKSKDSKRQNADMRNASSAYAKAYLPCVLLLSTQIDNDVLKRYQEQWLVLMGTTGVNDTLTSTYDFLRDIIGYDLADFFHRSSPLLQREIHNLVTTILRVGDSS